MSEKTQAEVMAERRDCWKAARAMLRESDMMYTVADVARLADWLNEGGYGLGDDE